MKTTLKAFVVLCISSVLIIFLLLCSEIYEEYGTGINNKSLPNNGIPPIRNATRDKQRRKEICTKYGLHKNHEKILKQHWLFTTIGVDDKRKVTFCFIPKVASGNWKRVFIMLNTGIRDPISISSSEAHRKDALKNLSTATPEEFLEISTSYLKFMIVRDPMERLLSAYLNKLYWDITGKFHKILGKKGLQKIDPNIPYEEQAGAPDRVSFPEFVDFVIKSSNKERMEIHWARFQRLCHPCLFDYDFVGRYENLDEDSTYILGNIPGAGDIKLPVVKTNKGSNTKKNMGRYFSQLSKKQIVNLLKVYQLDYELFDYPYPENLVELAQGS